MALLSLAAQGSDSADRDNSAQAAFDQLKSLQGRWIGEERTPDGQTKQIEYVYKVQSNGSAVLETAMAGEPEEMTTVFYMAGGQLQASHYCSIGNQPAFRFVPADDDRITMAFAGGTGFDPAVDGHVHEGWIRAIDSDHMEQNWVFYDKGVAASTMVMTLERQAD
jgi:hypothetical protein